MATQASPHNTQRYSHHRKALRAIVSQMQSLGYSTADCLANTQLSLEDLASEAFNLALAQEYQFYRNMLALSGSSAFGLELGKVFRFETYGLLGYGLLSSATIDEAIQTAVDFSPLTFSHFSIQKVHTAELGGIAFSPSKALPDDLITFYSDRDLVAALTGLRSISPSGIVLNKVRLIHNNAQQRAYYESVFGCEVEFNYHQNELLIAKPLMQQTLPRSDSQASSYCKEQCQLLLGRLSQAQQHSDRVRAELVAKPGEFPCLETIAQRLHVGSRTLKRQLAQENTNFQSLLQEIRSELAQEYLRSNMPIETIACRLGYSEAANFSHAFKRWLGLSPRAYRRQMTSHETNH